MQLSILTSDQLPTASRDVIDGIRADLGVVPNLAATAAASPALLAGFDGLRRAVASTTVDPVLRETAGVAVGVAVDNRYGVAFHSTMLLGLGVDPAEVEVMRDGGDPSDPAAAAVAALARELVDGRGKVRPSTIATVNAAGVSDEAILELVLEVTFASMVGVIDNLAGHVELDGFLAPQRWSR
jgi:alkylhydroperoxidase family enzyme